MNHQPTFPDEAVELLAKRIARRAGWNWRWLPADRRRLVRQKAKRDLDALTPFLVEGRVERLISAEDLKAAADQAHDGDALPDPQSAGFEENAIRDFLDTYPAFKVPSSRDDGEEVVHPGSLMAGLAIGAVAARFAVQQPHPEQDREKLHEIADSLLRTGGAFYRRDADFLRDLAERGEGR